MQSAYNRINIEGAYSQASKMFIDYYIFDLGHAPMKNTLL